MINLIHGDCLEKMKDIPDSSVDMVLTDPPYFKVKKESWDRQWDKPKEFLLWLDKCVEQWARVLKPNGSLYCFASPQMSARVEVLIQKRFNINNHIVWQKRYAHYGAGGVFTPARCSPPALRVFYNQSERVIFAEHYGADNIAKGEAGYQTECDKLRGFVFEPLRAYFVGEFKKAGLMTTAGKIAVNVACGFSASSGGMASRHYFSTSQWCLPTAEHYNSMQTLINGNGNKYLIREYEELRREYEELRREYEELRREYEELRRPFSVTASVPYTDVWTFEPVRPYKGKHPCEKPMDMISHIIEASTRENGVVLDCFMGSGTTGVACKNLNRSFIGIELDDKYFAVAKKRIEKEPDALTIENVCV